MDSEAPDIVTPPVTISNGYCVILVPLVASLSHVPTCLMACHTFTHVATKWQVPLWVDRVDIVFLSEFDQSAAFSPGVSCPKTSEWCDSSLYSYYGRVIKPYQKKKLICFGWIYVWIFCMLQYFLVLWPGLPSTPKKHPHVFNQLL